MPAFTGSQGSAPAIASDPLAPDLFQPEIARGWDLSDVTALADIYARRRKPDWLRLNRTAPEAVAEGEEDAPASLCRSQPGNGRCHRGVRAATAVEIDGASLPNRATTTAERAAALNRVADLYEQHFDQAFSLLAAEAGKTLPDAVAELREAVDFLRYYAARAKNSPKTRLHAGRTFASARGTSAGHLHRADCRCTGCGQRGAGQTGRGDSRACSPATGSCTRPAPVTALQLLPGEGSRVGAQLTGDPRINGVAFTGSTATACIQSTMADVCAPGTR